MGVSSKVKAVFLDRDGVINKAIIVNGQPYPPSSIEEMEILIGVKEGIDLLKKNGYLIFVVTNQPDVARGKTPIEKVEEINLFLEKEFSIDEVYCCYHDGKEDCFCRKPKPGMILEASSKWNIDLKNSFIVGDRWRDIEAGKSASISTILIDYNYLEKRVEPDYCCLNFSEAVTYILKSNNHKN